MEKTIEEEWKAETQEKRRKNFVVSIQFPHSLARIQFKFIISCSSFSWISTPFFFFLLFHLFFFFLTLLFLFISQLHMLWFPQYSLTFPSFSLVAAFYSCSLFSSISDPAFSFPILQFSSLSFFFTSSHSSSFLLFQFQTSFPHSLALLCISLASPCSSSSSENSSISTSSFFFSLFLFFLFSFFFLPLLFFFISQCDNFLNFPCHFLGAVLPAPALYPSLFVCFFYNPNLYGEVVGRMWRRDSEEKMHVQWGLGIEPATSRVLDKSQQLHTTVDASTSNTFCGIGRLWPSQNHHIYNIWGNVGLGFQFYQSYGKYDGLRNLAFSKM